MSGKGKLIIITFTAVALLSIFGLFHLFALRFETGDMFPPYSSLRSDPLGCKALFMALERTSGLDAGRNFRNLDKLKGIQGRTIYLLGSSEALLEASSDKDAKELEALAKKGNRLVIAFGEQKGKTSANWKQETETDSDDEEDADGADLEEDGEQGESAQVCTNSGGIWGVALGSYDPPTGKAKGRPLASLASQAFELPASIRLHSRRHFQSDGTDWRALYSYRDRAVVLERTVGKGSIVLLADSYLFSNEAMRNDRSPGLFAWLQGTNRTVLFDESHLGVYDNPGVMALIKKHHLVPFLLALLALAALYVWKSAIPFVGAAAPLREQREGGARDNFSGLVNLLRRNIAPGELLGTCLRQWSGSFSRELKNSPELAEQLQALVDEGKTRPAGKRDQVAVYRKMTGLIKSTQPRSHNPTCPPLN